MQPKKLLILTVFVLGCTPLMAQNTGTVGAVQTMHAVLQNVYTQMITLVSNITDLCRAIAAFGATFYIGVRVWKHIAHAEPIDFFPLFRPFVMILLIAMFPTVLAVINGVLEPTVDATAAMVNNSNAAINSLIAQSMVTAMSDPSSVLAGPNPQQPEWGQYDQPSATDSDSGGGIWSAIGDGFKFIAGSFVASIENMFKVFISAFLQVLYFAASICIDCMRTFQMVVLAILGPFAFAFSCYPGFENSLTHWLARYINVFLWLPIANIFGALLGLIEQNMLLLNQTQGAISMFSPTNFVYLIFLVIGTFGYFMVPSIANYIIHTQGGHIGQKMAGMTTAVVGMAVGAATGGTGGAAMGAAGSAGGGSSSGSGGGASGSGSASASSGNQYNADRISGNV